jgi:hypothetical protein
MARLHSLRESSGFDFVLKGRGFQPRRKCRKSTLALAAEGAFSLQCHFFRSLFSRVAKSQ